MGEAAEGRSRLADAQRIAPFCHEANRILTGIVKDVPVQPTWEESPEEMKKSSIAGVLFALENPDATPKAQHEEWSRGKVADGWTYGEVKDPVKKTHPALVEFEKLPEGTRAKDAMFQLIVKAMK